MKFKQGEKVINKTGIIIMVSSQRNSEEKYFSGMVIKSTDRAYPIGSYGTDWPCNCFDIVGRSEIEKDILFNEIKEYLQKGIDFLNQDIDKLEKNIVNDWLSSNPDIEIMTDLKSHHRTIKHTHSYICDLIKAFPALQTTS